ncbi:hypothetical protein M514_23999 [Trichuris suis]|uniref:Uncharacterized protein n=1 Tax=Trichuris suis TaxID=68888 RepID=A0A085N305_9BILA|nr:hypothetical protein M514_23999 [Trichuris suis]
MDILRELSELLTFRRQRILNDGIVAQIGAFMGRRGDLLVHACNRTVIIRQRCWPPLGGASRSDWHGLWAASGCHTLWPAKKTATDLSIAVLHRELHYKRREIIEALYIRHNRTINKDAAHAVSEAWLPLTAAHMCLHANPTEKHHLTAASIADGLSPYDYTREPTGRPSFP